MNASNVIKLTSPFERLKSYNLPPDIILRKAIITQAIIDATNVSEQREAKKYELEAKQWIFNDNDEFYNICMEAEIEVDLVRKVTKELITLHKNKVRLKNR